MSAIFGILQFDHTEPSARALEAMGRALASRGPDGRKSVVDGPIGLGHCLMRVNVEDRFEAQPLYDSNTDATLVADARIDNREELAEAFGWSADECRDRPDSDFILDAYKKWGDELAAHLLGDFVFAIWDGRAGKLLLSRDHMGQRCLFYHRGQSFLAFASAERALWAVDGVPRAVSEPYWIGMLVQDQNREPGATIFEGIGGLCGGTTMTVDASGAIVSRRYWEPRADPAHCGRDVDYYIATYRRVLEEAVACRLRRAAYPAGLFFSGGFDSAAIAGLSAPIMSAQGRKLLAASSVLPDGYEGPLRDARPRVEWCRRDMPHLDVRYVSHTGRTILTGLDRAFATTERLRGPVSHVNDALLQVVAGAGARIVMDGHGGDYTLNPTGSTTLPYLLRTGQLRRLVAELGPWRRRRRRSLFRTVVSDLLLNLVWPPIAAVVRGRNLGLPLFRPAMPVTPDVIARAKAMGIEPRILARALGNGATPVANSSLQTLCKLQNLPYSNGSLVPPELALDFTRPFHDKRVVEFALAIPQNLHVIAGQARWLARAALNDLYPPEFHAVDKADDDRCPDFNDMIHRIDAELSADIARMEKNPRLTRYFDFGAMRRLLADAKNPTKQAPTIAVTAFLFARYLDWFDERNA